MSTPSNTPDSRRLGKAETAADSADATTAPDGRSTSGASAVAAEDQRSHREEVLEREKEKYGGVKIGSAFFGWLTATGTAVILTALVAATGAAVGLGNANGNTAQVAQAATENANTVGIIGAIALLVVLFVAYFAGGYVAGRMARFNGAKQGLFVWLWAIVIAIVVAIIAAIAGSQYNILGNLNSYPRIPIDEGTLTVTGIITLVVVAVASLAGAILGGLAGMRFHRKVDRAGLGR
ncbi:hypothetical protein B7R22_02235 [Subtercola boreus]|uniref:Uncharacterized protein n=1 Tax=Subtercola boreus TaxID=120213 RepID=A0A3E0W574_9MICO|nr:hypothetical protein [Subtercola boreus]RFA16889.1 hypothetical protein B7R22_02235 [Subtercola boreus]